MRCEASLLDTVNDADHPVAAIFNDGPVRFVYKPVGGYYERIPIKTGRFSESYAEVLAGIEAGDDVLLRQPTAGEIIDKDWDKAELELVGLTLDEDGNPTRPMPEGMNGGAQPASFQQGGRTPARALRGNRPSGRAREPSGQRRHRTQSPAETETADNAAKPSVDSTDAPVEDVAATTTTPSTTQEQAKPEID